ncbi:hypothetical protein J3R83DRAFT_330 [Lanmaoa asiatica]|nr:hypothetical protein J3R83DRAFT_330 [Lanmaoa asiatica]
MVYLAQSLKDTISEEGYDLIPTISRRTGLLEISKFSETDPVMSCSPLERLDPTDDDPMTSNYDTGFHDSRDGLTVRNSGSDADTLAAPHEGLDLMRRLLTELRDPNLDCSPRSLSEDSDSEYYYDDDDDDEASVTPTWRRDIRRNSLESASSTPRTPSDVSDEGSIYPLTPPPKPATSLTSFPDVHKAHMASPFTPRFKEGVQVMSPTSSESPPSLPSKAYVRTHRDSRSLLYGPRLPLVTLPRF